MASSESKLAADEGDLWDSGRLAADQSIHIACAGRPLVSRMTCFWKARIWDVRDQESPWSPAACWTMGLLTPTDWQAQWIADAKAATVEQRGQVGMSPTTLLRREFQVGSPVRRATIHATGLGLYELRLNGRRVGDQVLAPVKIVFARNDSSGIGFQPDVPG